MDNLMNITLTQEELDLVVMGLEKLVDAESKWACSCRENGRARRDELSKLDPLDEGYVETARLLAVKARYYARAEARAAKRILDARLLRNKLSE